MQHQNFPQPALSFTGTALTCSTLGQLTTFSNGKSHEKQQQAKGKYELINLNSVALAGGLKPSGKFVDHAEQTLEQNDLVMVLSDLAYGNFLGKVALIPTANKYVLNQRVALIRIKDTTSVDPYFLFTYINSKQQYFKSMGAGGSQLNLSKKAVCNFPVYYPAFSEQVQLGQFFAQLDAQRQKLEQALAWCQELKNSVLGQVLTLASNGQPKLRYPQFKQAWQQEQVGKIFTSLTNGKRKKVKDLSPVPTAATPYPVYSAQTTNEGIMGYYSEYLFQDCITWTREGYAGQVNYRQGKFYCIDTCGVLLSDLGYSNKFFAENLNRVAFKYVVQTGIPKLYPNALSLIYLAYPADLDEQQRLGDLFTLLDQLIASYQKAINLHLTLKQALVQRLFV